MLSLVDQKKGEQMEVNNNTAYEILNSAMQQIWGQEAVTALSLKDLVSLGNTLIQSAEADVFDNLYKAMLDRIRMMIFNDRVYKASGRNIIRDYATYGALVEKVYFEPIQAEMNQSWALQNGKSIDPFKITLNTIKVKYFAKSGTWEVPYTVDEKMIRTAFISSEEMRRFVEAQVVIAQNSMEAQIEAMVNFTVCNFIACKDWYSKQAGAKGVHIVNLLTDYNALAGTTLTVAQARKDTKFLIYATQTITTLSSKMNRYNTTFNIEQFKRFTYDVDKRYMFLSDFVKDIEYNAYSNTFHDDYVKLDNFEEVPYWQGLGTNAEWDEVSSISVITENADDSSNYESTLSNIVGIVFDKDAMGVTIWDERTTSQYNGRGEYNNYWLKAEIGLFNDLSEQAIVFTLN